ncbi:unnamed protein product [Peronospora farinosa]|uniref:dolichol kinase n=1 Tax=Peronospora farinosa TaxID=134698 RepID=A0AAV0UJW3_9STRA|nr:unnamed protein product [Peronospora farinosa]CAI5737189.1 unnamed protein product [Peronospora farinosa]
MSVKALNQNRRAQVAETMVLALMAGWITYLIQKKKEYLHEGIEKTSRLTKQRLLQTVSMSYSLFVLYILGLSTVMWSICRHQTLSKALRASSRHERDTGLVVGCVLPPFVLFSRLLVGMYHEEGFSSFTFFYAWTSISIGVSVLLKVAVFGTVTSCSVNALVDMVLLPVAFGLFSPVEAEWRFLLATGGRVIVAAVLSAGFKLLPRSFTIGEAMLVAEGIGLCLYDLVLVTVKKVSECDIIDLQPVVLHPWLIIDIDRPDYVMALQVGMMGSLLVCVALIPLLWSYGTPSPTIVAQPLPVKGTVTFVLTVAVVVGGVVYPWSCFLLQTWNPIAWLLGFLMESSDVSVFLPPRFELIGYWAVCMVVLIPFFAFISTRLALRNIVARKLFHLLAVLMLGPASLIDASMLSLSYGVALSSFVLVECVRALALPPFGQSIAEFMRSFIDHREGGLVILTHSYLLLGCALPLWLASSSIRISAVAANAGVLALGVGDAMGATVGLSIGKRTIFGSKTVEGCAAVFISMMLASIPLHDYHLRSFYNGEHVQLVLLTAATILTTVLEAATAQIDNLVLPLFFYTACNLVDCHRV